MLILKGQQMALITYKLFLSVMVSLNVKNKQKTK